MGLKIDSLSVIHVCMNNLNPLNLFAVGDDSNYLFAAHWIKPVRFGQLLLLETNGKERENIVELITQWVLRGSFFIIVAGDWFVDHDDVRYSLFRYTNAFD